MKTMKGLELRKVDWGRNPAITRDSIEYNFLAISEAFNSLASAKLSEWTLSSLDAGLILSASTDLSSIFMLRNEKNDVIRIIAGDNVVTGGTMHRPVISISPSPSFRTINAGASAFNAISSGGTDLSNLFYTREEGKRIKAPDIGRNLLLFDGAISVRPDPVFDGITAHTASFDNITYKGRSLDELIPSHRMSDGVPYLQLRKVDWATNPAIMRDDVDYNFRTITHAYAALLEHKLDDIKLGCVRADRILSGSTPLSDVFLAKNANYDVVRLSAGNNIITGGTQNRPVIHVAEDPMFRSISANTGSFYDILVRGRSLNDIYFTREEGAAITHPELGRNLNRSSNGTIHVVSNPEFGSVLSDSWTANTASLSELEFKGRPLESWFGSHTFISAGKNIMTGGTAHFPVLSVIDEPEFVSVTSHGIRATDIVAQALTASSLNSMAVQSATIKVGSMIWAQDGGISLNEDVHISNGCITIGAPPEREISAFLRTKMRLVAHDSSPIHFALVVQNKEHAERRVLNEQTVDFVVRGDGHVGIGAFADLTSKLTIKSVNGHDQLRIVVPFTPKSTDDPRGETGNIAWDETYSYVKTDAGWKRTALESF